MRRSPVVVLSRGEFSKFEREHAWLGNSGLSRSKLVARNFTLSGEGEVYVGFCIHERDLRSMPDVTAGRIYDKPMYTLHSLSIKVLICQ